MILLKTDTYLSLNNRLIRSFEIFSLLEIHFLTKSTLSCAETWTSNCPPVVGQTCIIHGVFGVKFGLPRCWRLSVGSVVLKLLVLVGSLLQVLLDVSVSLSMLSVLIWSECLVAFVPCLNLVRVRSQYCCYQCPTLMSFPWPVCLKWAREPVIAWLHSVPKRSLLNAIQWARSVHAQPQPGVMGFSTAPVSRRCGVSEAGSCLDASRSQNVFVFINFRLLYSRQLTFACNAYVNRTATKWTLSWHLLNKPRWYTLLVINKFLSIWDTILIDCSERQGFVWRHKAEWSI